MNRVVKAAVAVTAFGLAAALAVPAQAEVQYNAARYAPTDGLGGVTNLAGSPLGGLLSGITGGGLLGGLLGGVTKSKSAAQPTGQMTEAERDAAIAARGRRSLGGPNAAEDVTRLGGPLPELSPIAGQKQLGKGGLTKSVPGASRLAQPATTNGALKGFEILTSDSTLAGLAQAARDALPGMASQLSSTVGQAPAEVTPLVAAVPGTTGSSSDLWTALGWTSDAPTSSVWDY
ncbi:hypothetical protein [Nonomuraea turcica]|uniref:hypothetical protein n=1 Tax=Nonomuraea sp. G32 TaxID=3067274 RepID=UPI00273AA7FE|nr:hypothetical protein [Nonomuraea sp. G32]MDP4506088.1 hypothetical protein [Nonomuraea sp. G32]